MAALAILPGLALANDAEIVMLLGKGDSKETAAAEWKPAAVKQQLQAGYFVRTREASEMGLLLRDRTQIRLSQLSILNIKSIGNALTPTRMDLPQGRAWSQTKPGFPQLGARRSPAIEFVTPVATAGIRGTDWELVVAEDGTTTLTVLSGEVDFYNDLGRVLVGPNEQARVAPGKAPVKILLTNAAERIQWVTAYRPQPRRWVKDLSGDIAAIVKNIETENYADALTELSRQSRPRSDIRVSLLRADLHLFQGEVADAIAVLSPYADDGNGDPMAAALLARALAIAGRLTDAARVLGRATQKHSAHVELLLSQAELARLQGNPDDSRRAALEVIKIDPANADAWYVIGRIETEREYVAAARDALKRAVALRPDEPAYQGELATLETFANEFAAADRIFREVLDRQPDDYVTLTGLGVLQLKRGQPAAALESFLKAGLIEPRYARAALFSAVAYYQLGERRHAVEALEKASALDEKDPLPHLMASLVHYDALELGNAIAEARKAQERLPYLKSLNQVLTDQKGNANLGSALAAYGLEEWSLAHAYNSYSPYWAGSHLFLADRFAGNFNKNSELFKGFLSDPSVFGASNRFSSLVAAPGNYASAGATVNRDYVTETGVNATFNGYNVSSKPFSYFLGLDKTYADSPINASNADGRMRVDNNNVVAGFGVRPVYELGIFAFANLNNIDGKIADRASGLTNDKFSIDYRRFDVGMNYKFSPTNHAWLKIGGGSEELPLSGDYFSQSVADTLNTAFATNIFVPAGRLNTFRTDQSQRDIQWRNTFDLTANAQISWGLEYAESKKPFSMELEFLPVRIRLNQDNRVTTGNAYLSGRFRAASTLDAQIDLHYQDTKSSFSTAQEIEVVGFGTFPLPIQTGGEHHREFNPRLGLKWNPAPNQTLRLAGQVWRKPAGVNTLAPVDTVGIALDDQVERVGGKLSRVRLQHEFEWDRSTFVQWFADAKRIRNLDDPGGAIVSDIQLDQLEKLRTRKRVYAVRQDYLEDTPKFGAGTVQSAGFAVNRLMSKSYTLATRYVFADTRNTTQAFRDLRVPFHPRHYVNLALNWQPRARWIVGPTATYRSSRYTDEANTVLLDGGWGFGMQVYWESEDKRWSAGVVVDQIHSNKNSSIYQRPVVQSQAIYRF